MRTLTDNEKIIAGVGIAAGVIATITVIVAVHRKKSAAKISLEEGEKLVKAETNGHSTTANGNGAVANGNGTVDH
ncbi:hypothetical protein NDN08_001540 [Rhodosorus marinus]|uniref:Uncharacterized protein n=1 Tax=Rhodosorus marinus TaxID=101924 RepID=A0AAV8UR91_9RHOD|nr:hypothetical protein NDN08_001540 [Rhodosorus marinus]